MVVEEQTLQSKLREKSRRSSRGTARWLHLRKETLITRASVSCYGGKYFIFMRVDVCGIAFEGRALMFGTLPFGRGRVSGQGSPGALRIYWR